MLCKKIVSFLCAVVMLFSCTDALALTRLNLPSALQEIEEEAFEGDRNVKGLVVVPDSTKKIGDRAFYGTNAYAISLPSNLTSVGHTIGSGLMYVRAAGKKTTFASDALAGTRYAFGNASGHMAGAGAETFYPLTEIKKSGNFYYHIQSGKASLLCAVDPDAVGTTVRIPQSVGDYPVENIRNDAFAGCGQLGVIYIPATVQADAGAFASVPDAAIRYYSDGFHVEYIESNRAEATVGDTVQWAAQASATGATYRFDLYDLGNDDTYTEGNAYSPVSSTETGTQNHISLKMDRTGTFAMVVTCTGSDGATATRASGTVVVGEGPVKALSITPEDITICSGEGCTWTAAYEGGTGTKKYQFTLKKDNKRIKSSTGTTLKATGLAEGEYVLTFTVTDGTGSSDTVTTRCTVVDESAFSPAAPVLTSDNMATDAENAPVYEQDDLEITWNPAEGAVSYGLIVEKQAGNTWTEVQRYCNIRDTGSVLTASVLTAEEETLFRVGLYSRNLGDGEPAWYYFRIIPVSIDRQVYIDGKTSAVWNQSSIAASTRSFVIGSTADWIAESNSEWASVKRSQDVLTVDMERNHSLSNRSATVTVSNGYTQATLTINQGYVYYAPEIVWPALSTDVNNPTTVGTGAPAFEWEMHNAKRVHIQVSQKTSSGWSNKFWVRSSGTSYSFANEASRKLVSGNVYRFRIMAIWDNDYSTNEVAGSQPYTDYYVRASDDANMILVNNSTALTVDLTDKYTMSEYLNVYSSSVFTVESDADWLSYGGTPAGGLTSNFYVKATDNLTTSARTGHLTLRCENAAATITVTQESMRPRILYPALSTNESSPTSVKKNDVNLVIYGSAVTIEKKSGSSYIDSGITRNLKDKYGCHEIEIETSELATSTTYRVTVSHGGINSAYYFKTSTSNTSYVYVNGFGTDTWEAPVSGGTESITLKASGSWTASAKSNWLTVSSTSGSSTSGKTLKITAAANSTGSMRTGVIEFKVGTNYTAYFIVTQNANKLLDASFEASGTASLTVPGNDDNYRVRLSHTGTATLSSQVSWITCSASTVASYTSLSVEENGTGSDRTGSVVVTEDGRSVTLQITQHANIPYATLTSHSISQTSSAPTLLPDTSMTITWQRISQAKGYRLLIRDEDAKKEIMRDYFAANQTSFKVPDDLFEMNKKYSFYLFTYDSYGGSYSPGRYYFMITQPDTVLINKSQAAVWNNADDYGDSEEFIVLAPDSWQVSSRSDWLTVSATSGAPGDKITVTAQENLGAARTGTVTIRCGNGTATLTVHQCAYLSEQFQKLISPVYSSNKAEPTILPAGTTSITVNWEAMPQATCYEVEIDRMVSTFSSVTVSSSRRLYDGQGTYTFKNLSLEAGNVYELQFVRSCERWGSTGCIYYFMIGDSSARLEVDEDEIYLDGDNDYAYIGVDASGAWTATTDAGWFTLTKNYNSEIAEDDPEEYDTFVSSGSVSSVCITAKENNTGHARTGKVTLRCGSVVKEVTVHQSVYYTYAELTNLNLSRTSSDPTGIAHEDLNLRWSASSGGTGSYELTLKKKEGISYQKVWSRSLNSLSATIPVSYLEEGTTYLLFLGTEATDEDSVYGIRYFFTVKYENELALNIDVDWEQIANDSYMYIKAYAGGGSRSGYQYAYELYKEGTKVNETTWMSLNRYNFQVNEPGSYSVRVYLKDSTGTMVTADSASKAVSAEDTSRVTVNTPSWNAPVSGDTLNVTVTANSTWTAESSATWLTAVKQSETVLQLKAAANLGSEARSAVVTVRCGKASKTVTVTQGAQQSGSVSLSEEQWILNSVFADEKIIRITSGGAWTVSAASVPDWLSLSSMTGTNGDSLSMRCAANNGAARTCALVFTSGGASASFTVSQPGSGDSAQILSASIDGLTLVGTATRLRINAKNADSVCVMVNGAVEGPAISVTNGYQYISHTFETGGNVQVQLVPYRNGAVGAVLNMGTVNIRTFGTLGAPVLSYERSMLQGASQEVSWDTVPSAETYGVVLKYGNDIVKAWSVDAPQTSVLLTCEELADIGTYVIEVSARAYGYDSGSTAGMITTRMPEINFSITEPRPNQSFVKGDLMDIRVSNPDGYHIAVKVTPDHPSDTNPVVWLPADGSTRSDTVIEGVFLFRPSATDTYTFEAMAWATETRGTESRAWHDSSRQVRIGITGPTFRNVGVAIDGGGSGPKLRSTMNEVCVQTNNAVNSVSLYIDNSQQPAETKDKETDYEQDSNYTRTWRFNLSAPAGGTYHAYTVAVSDGDQTIQKTINVYCVTDYDTKAVYSRNNGLTVYRYPTGKTKDAVGTIDMMEECTLFGTYGKYSYIKSSELTGFVLTSGLSDQIIYDTSRIELRFIESQNIPEFMYSYVGAPQIKLSWYSNMLAGQGSLVYRVNLVPQYGGVAKEADLNTTTAYWRASTPGTYRIKVSLYDTVKDETVKTATATPYYVISANRQEYINTASQIERNNIYYQANVFERSLNDYFNTMDIEATANNPFVKIYELVDLEFNEFFETDASKSADIAEAILVNLAQSVDTPNEISLEAFSNFMDLMGVPGDIQDALVACSRAKLSKILSGHVQPDGVQEIADMVIDHWRSTHSTLSKIMNKMDKAGDIITYGKVAVDIIESIINAVIVINKFASVPQEQINLLIRQFSQSDNNLLKLVALELAAFKTEAGRIAYATAKITWQALEGVIEIGKTFTIKKAISTVGGAILMGISIGTTIGDLTFNSGDIATSSTRCKWAVESIREFLPAYTDARNAFYNNPTAQTYKDFALAIVACQQLVLNAYGKMITFMQEVDSTWFKTADYGSAEAAALDFQANSNELIGMLDNYWAAWLQGQCEMVSLPQAAAFSEN